MNTIVHQIYQTLLSNEIHPGIQACFNIWESINVINHSNKCKTNMILSIGTENTFDKIQYLPLPYHRL